MNKKPKNRRPDSLMTKKGKPSVGVSTEIMEPNYLDKLRDQAAVQIAAALVQRGVNFVGVIEGHKEPPWEKTLALMAWKFANELLNYRPGSIAAKMRFTFDPKEKAWDQVTEKETE